MAIPVRCIAVQANGAIYDTDQQSAEMRRREREEPQSKKKRRIL